MTSDTSFVGGDAKYNCSIDDCDLPLVVVCIGCTQFFCTIALYFVTRYYRERARLGSRKASELLTLPVYNLAYQYVLFMGLVVSTSNALELVVTNVWKSTWKFTLYTIPSVGIAFFLMHQGVGNQAMKRSVGIALISSSIVCGSALLTYFYSSQRTYFAVWAGCLSMYFCFYMFLWLAPYSLLHRRPAAVQYGRYMSITTSMLTAINLYVAISLDSMSVCICMTISSCVEFLLPIIILRTMVADSRYWQGLVNINSDSSLNQPLVGMWDHFGRDTIATVADTIETLEKQVIPIIPFGNISMDTNCYVAGGAARVYRGKVKNQEVAIKMLFCIDLTPERVVDFCREATLLYSLRSPNVVMCNGVSIMPPALCLLTEYCLYGSLFDFLHTERTFEFVRFIRSVYQDKYRDDYNDAVSYGMKKSKATTMFDMIGGLLRGQEEKNPEQSANQISKRDEIEGVAIYSPMDNTRSSFPATNSFSVNMTRTHGMSEGGSSINTKASRQYLDMNDIESSRSVSTRISITQREMDKEKFKSAASYLNSKLMGYGLGPKGQQNKFEDLKVRNRVGSASKSHGKLVGKLLLKQSGDLSKNKMSEKDLEKRISFFTSSDGVYSDDSGLQSRDSNFSQNNSSNNNNNHNSLPRSSSGLPESFYIPENLRESFLLGKSMPYLLKLRMARDCCAGVEFLHSKGLLHCDIKSLNFLVTENLVVKLSDLGEARAMVSKEGLHSSEARALPQNINWTAPEVLDFAYDGFVNFKADVWSLTMVIAELMSGEVPFDTETLRRLEVQLFLEKIGNFNPKYFCNEV